VILPDVPCVTKLVAVIVPLAFKLSLTCIAVDSVLDNTLVCIVLAVSVPCTFNPSSICMAEDSEEEMLLVTNVLAVSVPATFNPSLTCIAVLSSEFNSLVTKVFAVSVPDTFTASLICMAVLSADDMLFTEMLSGLNDPAVSAPDMLRAPVIVVLPTTCNVVLGSEVPMPTRLLVTSRYNRFVSNARSTPLRVRLLFNTDPDIRPMAILMDPLYKNISTSICSQSPVTLWARQYRYLCCKQQKGLAALLLLLRKCFT
jgi:hypothetical protein